MPPGDWQSSSQKFMPGNPLRRFVFEGPRGVIASACISENTLVPRTAPPLSCLLESESALPLHGGQ